MKVVCKKKTIEGANLRYPITLSQEYLVMGLAIYKDSSCLHYLIDDGKFPFWYPYLLFDILDNSLPNNWYIEIFNKNSPGAIFYLHGFYELCNNEDYHDALMERESWAMEIYFKRKQECFQVVDRNYISQTASSEVLIKEAIILKLIPYQGNYVREEASPHYISNQMRILEKFLTTDGASIGASHIIHYLEQWYGSSEEMTTGFNAAIISKKPNGKVALNYGDLEGSQDLIISFQDLMSIAKTFKNLKSNYCAYIIIEHENDKYLVRGANSIAE